MMCVLCEALEAFQSPFSEDPILALADLIVQNMLSVPTKEKLCRLDCLEYFNITKNEYPFFKTSWCGKPQIWWWMMIGAGSKAGNRKLNREPDTVIEMGNSGRNRRLGESQQWMFVPTYEEWWGKWCLKKEDWGIHKGISRPMTILQQLKDVFDNRRGERSNTVKIELIPRLTFWVCCSLWSVQYLLRWEWNKLKTDKAKQSNFCTDQFLQKANCSSAFYENINNWEDQYITMHFAKIVNPRSQILRKLSKLAIK